MNHKPTDEELVCRIKQGDVEALEALVKSYLHKTYNRVRNLVSETDAEDVTQEVFLTLVRSIDSFDGKSAFSTWFYRIIMNKVSDYYRLSMRRENMEQFVIESLKRDRDIIADPWAQKDAEVSEITIKKILMDIPEKEREIILLRLSDNLSFQEIAAELGLTYEAARSRYRRAIELIRQKLKKQKK